MKLPPTIEKSIYFYPFDMKFGLIYRNAKGGISPWRKGVEGAYG